MIACDIYKLSPNNKSSCTGRKPEQTRPGLILDSWVSAAYQSSTGMRKSCDRCVLNCDGWLSALHTSTRLSFKQRSSNQCCTLHGNAAAIYSIVRRCTQAMICTDWRQISGFSRWRKPAGYVIVFIYESKDVLRQNADHRWLLHVYNKKWSLISQCFTMCDHFMNLLLLL